VRTLRGRIGLTLLVFGLITLLTLGGSLWFALRDLHRDAMIGSLTELTAPWASNIRTRIPGAAQRPGDGTRAGIIERIRDGEGQADDEFRTFLETFEEDIEQAQVSVVIVQGDNSLVLNPEEGTASVLSEVPEVHADLVRGQVATGSTEIEGLGEVVYATTPIFGNIRGGSNPPLIMLARADDSAEQATADLIRALAIASIVLLIVGVPLAVGLGRSVTGPLRRLSEATGDVARGKVPESLPTSGPIEVAEASAAFNAMAFEVGATREAQRQLLADIRHDLRTPLTVIGGFSEALKDGTASGDAAVRAADAISDEAGRLERMLDDLDHLTVPGVVGPPLRLQSIDGLEVAQSAVERFAPEAENREQALVIDAEAARATLTADRDALDRILGNIIANALAHAPSPGGHVTLEVKARDRRVTLAVVDDGPGIPTAALSHVFDRFYRADPSRTSRGSGLGLAIVRDLAEALGGEAFAENVEDNGARVGVTLPATPPATDPPGAA
jgi:signal transduction histidine kinase